jgi:hypothetical protein
MLICSIPVHNSEKPEGQTKDEFIEVDGIGGLSKKFKL